MAGRSSTSPRARFRELHTELIYWQNMNRLDARSLKKGIEKCKTIAAEMRAIRKELKK